MHYQYIKAVSSLPPAGELVNLRFTKGSWLILELIPDADPDSPANQQPAALIIGSAPTCPEALRIVARLRDKRAADAPALRALSVGKAAREYWLHT